MGKLAQLVGKHNIAILLIAASVGVLAQNIRKPENQMISLNGTIRLVHGFGPPGYGETPERDAHVSYWAIQTAQPVTAIPAQKDFDCIPTNRMNLFFAGFELKRLMDIPAAKWKDQYVTITGKIHCADTAGEMTSLYIDVDSIAASTKR